MLFCSETSFQRPHMDIFLLSVSVLVSLLQVIQEGLWFIVQWQRLGCRLIFSVWIDTFFNTIGLRGWPVVQKACGVLVTLTWSLLLVYFSICCSSALSCVSVLLPLPWCYWSYGSAVSSRVKAGTTKPVPCGLLCTLKSSVLSWKFVGLSVLYHGEFDCHGV